MLITFNSTKEVFTTSRKPSAFWFKKHKWLKKVFLGDLIGNILSHVNVSTDFEGEYIVTELSKALADGQENITINSTHLANGEPIEK